MSQPYIRQQPLRKLRSLALDLWAGMLELLYPPKCLVCDEMQPDYFCESCQGEITYLAPPLCLRCGGVLQEGKCQDCREIEFSFDSARAVGIYDGTLQEAIHKLKYGGHRVLAPVLGAMMVEYLRSRSQFTSHIGCIVPMPIHPSRLRERGFNQSELLAREIGHALKLPVLPRILVRSKSTRPQVELAFEKRRTNVQDAFHVTREDAVDGRIVLLIDDVLTTGSTADAAARVLRDAGAREIHVFTLARSV